MNIEQARAHYDSEIDYKRRKAAGLIKAIKGLGDELERWLESHRFLSSGMCLTISGTAASITQFAVQLQEATADIRRCEELKNQLGEFLNNEVAV